MFSNKIFGNEKIFLVNVVYRNCRTSDSTHIIRNKTLNTQEEECRLKEKPVVGTPY